LFYIIILQVDLPIQKTQLFSYYSKTKGFYLRIIIIQFKIFSIKISHFGKTTFIGKHWRVSNSKPFLTGFGDLTQPIFPRYNLDQYYVALLSFILRKVSQFVSEDC